MFNFIQAEFLKLKNSKIFLLTVLCSLFPAFLLYLGYLEDPTLVSTFEEILYVNTQYVIGLLAVLLFSIVVSYLIGREYNEHTLKLIMTAPTSKFKYLLGKYLMFLIWAMILIFVAFLSSIAIGLMMGVSGFTFDIIVNGLWDLMYGGFLLFLTMSPFVFLAMIINNMVPAMIGGAVLVIANLMISSSSYAAYFPWFAPYMIISGDWAVITVPSYVSYTVILVTFIIGILISYLYFVKKDVSL